MRGDREVSFRAFVASLSARRSLSEGHLNQSTPSATPSVVPMTTSPPCYTCAGTSSRDVPARVGPGAHKRRYRDGSGARPAVRAPGLRRSPGDQEAGDCEVVAESSVGGAADQGAVATRRAAGLAALPLVRSLAPRGCEAAAMTRRRPRDSVDAVSSPVATSSRTGPRDREELQPLDR